ncbi:competence type IV pilus minor pilin ComGD [Bacillus tuaregi]|uniref:competence type IV pilus minor pilin ComGD n=1 Tax=Bacillus tuaregi TaxID=1816695 RepID=UPI0008F8FEB3|nr:competence type IV pilus minor pilin ComGD [Bacillus tuaregi]
MESKQSGFTLIEILIVLSIFLIISSITSIFLKPQYLWYEKERFFSQFKADILYTQQYAISHQKQLSLHIFPKEKRYTVKEKTTGKSVIERELPQSIQIEKGTLATPGLAYMIIEFSPNGRLNRFGNFYFLVDYERYKITFQIGAGRFYVVKE